MVLSKQRGNLRSANFGIHLEIIEPLAHFGIQRIHSTAVIDYHGGFRKSMEVDAR